MSQRTRVTRKTALQESWLDSYMPKVSFFSSALPEVVLSFMLGTRGHLSPFSIKIFCIHASVAQCDDQNTTEVHRKTFPFLPLVQELDLFETGSIAASALSLHCPLYPAKKTYIPSTLHKRLKSPLSSHQQLHQLWDSLFQRETHPGPQHRPNHPLATLKTSRNSTITNPRPHLPGEPLA